MELVVVVRIETVVEEHARVVDQTEGADAVADLLEAAVQHEFVAEPDDLALDFPDADLYAIDQRDQHCVVRRSHEDYLLEPGDSGRYVDSTRWEAGCYHRRQQQHSHYAPKYDSNGAKMLNFCGGAAGCCLHSYSSRCSSTCAYRVCAYSAPRTDLSRLKPLCKRRLKDILISHSQISFWCASRFYFFATLSLITKRSRFFFYLIK